MARHLLKSKPHCFGIQNNGAFNVVLVLLIVNGMTTYVLFAYFYCQRVALLLDEIA